MKELFEEIYRTAAWGVGSGEGSDPRACRPYVAFLQRFLREREIRSVADFGCGDWRFSRLVDWSGIDYRGYDVVGPVIEACRAEFGRPGVSFERIEGRGDEMADADLLLVKDVFQHWSFASIHAFLPELHRFRYALITNTVAPTGRTVNVDCADSDYRPLDIRDAPFQVEGTEVLSFWTGKRAWIPWRPGTRTRKSVVLVG